MKRVDQFRVLDDDEEWVCGIVLFKGKLQWAEGSKSAADSLLTMHFVIAGPHGEITPIRGVDDPDNWLKWAPFRLSNAYGYVTEPYEDDDFLYDPATGIFIGDESNPPLPTDEEMDAIANQAIACTDTESIRRLQTELTTPEDRIWKSH